MLVVTIISMLSVLLWTRVSGQCVTFQFTEQPPRSLDCSPYRDGRWRLSLRCSVEKLDGSDTFDVHWFQRLSIGTVLDHGRPDLATSGETLNRATFGGHWTSRIFNEDMVGEYWCQVIRTTQEPHEYLGISNMVTIHEPAYYGQQSSCSGVVVNTTVTCADAAPAVPSSASLTTSSVTFPSSIHSPVTSSFKPSSSNINMPETPTSVAVSSTSSTTLSTTIVASLYTETKIYPSTTAIMLQTSTSFKSGQNGPTSSRLPAPSDTVSQAAQTSTTSVTATKQLVMPSLLKTASTTHVHTASHDRTKTTPSTMTITKPTTEMKSAISESQSPSALATGDGINESKLQLWIAIAALVVAALMLIVTSLVLTATTVIICHRSKEKRGSVGTESYNITICSTENSSDRACPHHPQLQQMRHVAKAPVQLYDEVQMCRYVQPNAPDNRQHTVTSTNNNGNSIPVYLPVINEDYNYMTVY